MKQLLRGEKMGDEKPSQFLRRLQINAGRTFPDDLFRMIWMQGLPTKFRTTMVTQRDKTLSELADMADDIQEATSSDQNICEVSTSRETELLLAIERLRLEVAEVRQQVDNRRSRGRSPTPYRGRKRSNARPHSSQPSDECWYHWKYQDRARKCVPPCKWTPPANAQGSR